MLIRYRKTTHAQLFETRTTDSDLGTWNMTSLRWVSDTASERTDSGCAGYRSGDFGKKSSKRGGLQLAWEHHIICSSGDTVLLKAPVSQTGMSLAQACSRSCTVLSCVLQS